MGIFKLNNNLHSLADIRAQISDSMRVCVCVVCVVWWKGVFMSGIYVEKFQLFSDLFNYACIASAYTQQDSNNSNEEHYKLIFKCATLESCLSINS